jgi:hypothetical protein
MRDADRQAFEVQLEALFGAYPEIPLTSARRAGYWRGLAGMALEVFERCVDRALGPRGERELPNVSRVWEISRELRTSGPATDPARPSVQYLLACYVNRHAELSPLQLARRWTYLQVGGQIAGVLIPADDQHAAIRVMVFDLDLDAIWREEQAARAEVLERAKRTVALPHLPTPAP